MWLLQVVWGLLIVGSAHARFSDFVTDPTTVIRHLWALVLVLARAKRYIGHSPAGAIIVALLVFMTAIVTTGPVRYAEEEGGGPLASLYVR